MNILDFSTHRRTGSPAGQLLNLSVCKTREQLWPCRCKTSGKPLGSTEHVVLLKTTCSGEENYWCSSPFLCPSWHQPDRCGKASFIWCTGKWKMENKRFHCSKGLRQLYIKNIQLKKICYVLLSASPCPTVLSCDKPPLATETLTTLILSRM